MSMNESDIPPEDNKFWQDRRAVLDKPYEIAVLHVRDFAYPLASRKLTKKIVRLMRKALEVKNCLRGKKHVNKAIRRELKGIVILGGDADPFDTISHFPILCESKNIPYVYVPSSNILTKACEVLIPVECVFIQNDESYQEYFQKVFDKINSLPPAIDINNK